MLGKDLFLCLQKGGIVIKKKCKRQLYCAALNAGTILVIMTILWRLYTNEYSFPFGIWAIIIVICVYKAMRAIIYINN